MGLILVARNIYTTAEILCVRLLEVFVDVSCDGSRVYYIHVVLNRGNCFHGTVVVYWTRFIALPVHYFQDKSRNV